MKLSDVKAQIDAYFDNLNPDDLIKRFEMLGYEFEPINDEFEHVIDEYDSINVNLIADFPAEMVYFPNSPLISYPEINSFVFELLYQDYIESKVLNIPNAGNTSYAMAA